MKKRATNARLISRAVLHRSLSAFVLTALLSAGGNAQGRATISGVVIDGAGAAVQNATVELRTTGGHVTAKRTDDAGRFEISIEPPEQSGAAAALIVSAHGFAAKRVELLSLEQLDRIEVRLEPAPIVTRIEVEASKTDSADGETVVSHTDIARSAAVTIDDALRQVPGFSLFRRSGSLTA